MLKIQYYDGTSFMHKLHPTTKLLWLIVLSLIIFFFQSIWVSCIVFLFLLLIILFVKNNFLRIRGLRFAFVTAMFLFSLQVIFNHNGNSMINFLGIFNVGYQGLIAGILISTRFLIIILTSYLFVLTTSPNSLAVALMKLGLPYRFGYILITALRLIPILQEDITTINHAQIVRGVNFRSNLFQKLWVLPRQFLLPVLVVSMRRVDALNFSMEGRCFGKYPTRTYLQEDKFKLGDSLSLFLLAGIVTLSFYY